MYFSNSPQEHLPTTNCCFEPPEIVNLQADISDPFKPAEEPAPKFSPPEPNHSDQPLSTPSVFHSVIQKSNLYSAFLNQPLHQFGPTFGFIWDPVAGIFIIDINIQGGIVFGPRQGCT